jgi:hypothetical protein
MVCGVCLCVCVCVYTEYTHRFHPLDPGLDTNADARAEGSHEPGQKFWDISALVYLLYRVAKCDFFHPTN